MRYALPLIAKKLDPGIAVGHRTSVMSKIIDALESERARIDKALHILRGETTESKARLDRLSPAARARIAEAQKARWRQYRKQQAA